MAQQRGSHFEWDSEILQPGGEGVAEIVEVEVSHFRLAAQSSSERAEGRRIPSPEDFPVHMDEIAPEGLVGGRIEGNSRGVCFNRLRAGGLNDIRCFATVPPMP